MANRTVALDFDGCLHPYTDGWTGHTPAAEPPSAGAVDFLVMCKSRGFDVVVFSCRARDVDGLNGIRAWLIEHGLAGLVADVTYEKPLAFAYVDDRAVSFRGDWIETLLQVNALAALPTGPAHRV